GVGYAPFFRLCVLPPSVSHAHVEYWRGSEEIAPQVLPSRSSSFLLPPIPHETPRWNCGGGSTISVNILSASREPKLLSKQSRRLRAFLQPRKRCPAMASIRLGTPILLSRTQKTIWPMSSILAGLVKTIGYTTCRF